MTETLKRLAEERRVTLKELDRITQNMKYAAHSAREQGLIVPKIAQLLGLTKRTVYLWMR